MTAAETAAPVGREQTGETAEKAFSAGLGKLALALAKAQGQAERVVKDKTNSHHGYNYASADALIGAAKEALRGCGLALIPTKRVLEYGGTTDQETGEERPAGRLTLRRDYILVHESGQSVDLSDRWPVLPDKGKPIDKALAIAATASLGYLMRDLLLMPRGDAEDMDADQNEAATTSEPVAQAPAQAANFVARPITDDVVAEELRSWGVETVFDLNPDQVLAPEFKRFLSEAAKAALGDADFGRVAKAWEIAGAPGKQSATFEQGLAFVLAVKSMKPPATAVEQMASDLADGMAQLQALSALPPSVSDPVRQLGPNQLVPAEVLRELFSFLSSDGALGSGNAARAAFTVVGIDKLPAPPENPVMRRHIEMIALNLQRSVSQPAEVEAEPVSAGSA